MYEQAEPVRSPFSRPECGQTSRPLPQPPPDPVHQPKGASDKRQHDQGTSSDTYAEAERVYYTIKDEDLPPSLRGVGRKQESPQGEVGTSGPPPQSPPVLQGGSRGRVRHGNGASDNGQEGLGESSDTCEEAEEVKRHATHTTADRTYPGEASGRGALCSYIRSHRSYMIAGIAVMLSLVGVGLAPLTFINKEEISQLSTAVDALKCDQDDMHQLSTAVDALKRNQDDMHQLATAVDALKRNQDDMHQLATTVDALKRNQDDMHQLSIAVDALKRDQDDMRQLSIAVDALKVDLKVERNRTAALEQRFHEKTSCPRGYTMWNETCYKVFNTRQTFSDAAVTCHENGGTLAMPRDAETNAFLVSLVNQFVSSMLGPGYWPFWFGLHDRREEGSFEWMDGSALGAYNNWGPGQPDHKKGSEDCVLYNIFRNVTDWTDFSCSVRFHFICQAAPGIFIGPAKLSL
uniref:C-type lectin domain-containing protein n=1 Tax=Branchiostoma floridae TaxID=7739 RepID=C3YSR4_BRAFL|eukprot:XP_002600753.1 hypothetical protein BRAFLDRAFT_83496 [Branchiostoma floridae]